MAREGRSEYYNFTLEWTSWVIWTWSGSSPTLLWFYCNEKAIWSNFKTWPQHAVHCLVWLTLYVDCVGTKLSFEAQSEPHVVHTVSGHARCCKYLDWQLKRDNKCWLQKHVLKCLFFINKSYLMIFFFALFQTIRVNQTRSKWTKTKLICNYNIVCSKDFLFFYYCLYISVYVTVCLSVYLSPSLFSHSLLHLWLWNSSSSSSTCLTTPRESR